MLALTTALSLAIRPGVTDETLNQYNTPLDQFRGFVEGVVILTWMVKIVNELHKLYAWVCMWICCSLEFECCSWLIILSQFELNSDHMTSFLKPVDHCCRLSLFCTMQLAAENLLYAILCVHQHLCYCSAGYHNCSTRYSIQSPVAVCSSGICDVLHVGTGIPLSCNVRIEA